MADVIGPVLTSVSGSKGGSSVTATGSSNEAGTVHCMVGTAGASNSASGVKSAGTSQSLAAAGSFSIVVSGAAQSTDSVYCVGEDSFNTLGDVVEASLNSPPTNIALSSDTVAENSAEGTDVGTLSATDADAGDTATYSIESQGVADAFKISGDKLQVGPGGLDFETTTTITVTVRVTDSGSATIDQSFTIIVTDVNEAPTAITLSGDTVEENSDEGTDIATLSATDPDAGDTATYSIESQGVADAFKISGDKLQVGAAGTSLEQDAVVAVTVRVTDAGGLSVLHDATITVTKATTNVVVLGIITGALVVVAGFSFAMFGLQTASGRQAAAAAGGNVAV